jgi:hypothetical protein
MSVVQTQSTALDAHEAMTRLYRESRCGALQLSSLPLDVPAHLRVARLDDSRRRIALPAPITSSKGLQHSLDARTSVRTYDRRAIGVAELATMLRVAIEGDRIDWPGEAEAGVDLHLTVVAWRVDGLEPAVWRYEPRTRTLAHVGRAPHADEAASLTLQMEFTTAPALVFITGSLAAACARHGGWGHRQLLLRGGAAGERLWLAALGVGLAGSVFAGFLPRAADDFANIDGYLDANLLAFAVGHPERKEDTGSKK